jgi:hypothetical protein
LDLSEASISTPEMVQRDRQLDKLLEERTRELFEKIYKNEYSPEGSFRPTLVRDDVYALANEIATLYGADPENPLAGVSAERALRAGSRCCLKFLVELDRLPLDVRTYDLASIYSYVRQAVKVYSLYRSASPYMGLLRGAWYGARIAMGANPLTLGAWWFAGSLSSKGASALASSVANRWALNFLHDIVRIVGYEVASVYDENLRYRDPNWCFAAELTELVQHFPSSELSLRRALSLVGSLQLRNEYDRIFFFRCIVEGKRPGLGRIQASDLPPDRRKEIAERLEGFLESYITDPTPRVVERWRAGVENRLDIALTLDGPIPARPENEQAEDAIRSLAGYLLEIKQSDPEQLESSLAQTTLVQELPEEEVAGLRKQLQDNPPFFFEMPELVPGGSVAEAFLQDLASLAVQVSPRYRVADEIVVSTAVHLRSDAGRIKALLDREYVDQVARQLPDDAPVQRLPPDVARAVLDLVQPDEELHFVYGDVVPVDSLQSGLASVDGSKTWLVGVGNRLVVFTMGDTPQLLWEGDRNIKAEYARGYVKGSCQLNGGRWLYESITSTPRLLLKGTLIGSSKRHFNPLTSFCSQRS